ncbi:MAG: hypothetical protein HZA01_09380 [Nitrospinae bacterium]|nr:hypothetical protein [Nitrospinota bacterium]
MENLVSVRYGLLFALITLIYGFGLGGAFGAFEENIMGHLEDSAKQVLSATYNGDEAKMKKTIEKSWTYFKRAHLHANGLGASALALILLVSFLPVGKIIKSINAICLGAGSFGYSMFWMLAGLKAPGMGSTGLAKESMKWLAVPSAGLCIIGVLMVFGSAIITLFFKGNSSTMKG